MKNIFDLTKEELAARIIALGGKKFNAAQVFNWLYKNRVETFSAMSNLSRNLRPKLEEEFELPFFNIVRKAESRNEDAVKYLFELADGKKIESVLMLQPYGNTLCVSTQVGCAYGCFMCATGKMGLIRNLLPGEMTGQLLAIEKDKGVKVKNIVFMGMGEPLANYDNLKKAIELFSDSDGIGVNQRRITVSTCGILPGIKKLIEDKLRVKLSISLHSTFDSVRDKLVPVNKKYNLAHLFETLREYCTSTMFQITIEYVLIEGINDGIGEVDNLITLIRKYNLGVKVKNIVFMGMGEPLANYDNLKKAIELFSDSDGIGVNQRRITVSTCGILPGIKKLIEDKLRVKLSISLHSTFDSVRDKLVPVNKKYNLAHLFETLREYCTSTMFQITIEYVLIEGINDGIGEVDNLITLIRKYNLDVKVNIIPVNPVNKLMFSKEEIINLWQKKLENARITSTVRIERGADILAACGQLAGEG
ncbi:MAG: hypothetical protein A2231_00230 [Candidatus Firestonebacteria bacterium RIFOXYA2_FULL_40_8]|nr:MAG: hypothetical protein A2231_00230 [Candidatus Firestonebacteria bacterium RIFOXYA2_FULL_40_8]